MVVLRHTSPRCDRLPRARTRSRHGQAALVLYDSRERRAAKAGTPNRSGGSGLTAGEKMSTPQPGSWKESKETRRAREESGDAIFAQESDSVHIAGGRRDRRADSCAGLQGRKLGGPSAAI